METHTYRTVKKQGGYVLARRDDGKFVVYQHDEERHQVYSAMPGDMPPGSGRWYANATNGGIAYVTNGYSQSYATRKYREFVSEAANV